MIFISEAKSWYFNIENGGTIYWGLFSSNTEGRPFTPNPPANSVGIKRQITVIKVALQLFCGGTFFIINVCCFVLELVF